MDFDLLLLFFGYFLSLMIGFAMFPKTKKQNELNTYGEMKWILYMIITAISAGALFYVSIIEQNIYIIRFIALFIVIFLIYFYLLVMRKTRCWKQHRMLIYHFLLIPILYYTSLVLDTKLPYFVIFLIYIYNILEFQYARFNSKKWLIWD